MSTATEVPPLNEIRRNLQFQSIEEVISEMQLMVAHIEQLQINLKQKVAEYYKNFSSTHLQKEAEQELNPHQQICGKQKLRGSFCRWKHPYINQNGV